MNHWLTTWLLWLLGVDLPASGEGLEWELEGSWAWNRHTVMLLGIFAILSVCYVVYFYLRERCEAGRGVRLLLSVVRLSLIALVLLVLVFQLHINFTRMSLPQLAVVVDRSASMETVDDYRENAVTEELEHLVKKSDFTPASRWNIVRSVLLEGDAAPLKELADRYSLRFYTMASRAQQESQDVAMLADALRKMEADGTSSRLGMSLQSVLEDLRAQRPAAVLVFTDGITTEGISLVDAAIYARSQAVPLYLVGIGSAEKVSKLELSDLVVDEIVFVNDYVDFDFKMTPYSLEGKEVDLVLKDKATGEELARRRVVAGKDGIARREKLSHRPTRLGTMEYVIEVANLEDTLKGERPQLSREIEVRDDPIKVLLVGAVPSFEYQYLKNLLERDHTLDLNVVLQEADIEYPQQDQYALPLFPVSQQQLFAYDVLILGDVNLDLLSHRDMENIVAFVKEKGGGLLLSAGSRFRADAYKATPLAELLPVEFQDSSQGSDNDLSEGFRIEPTPLGMTSPHMQLGDTRAETEAIWKALPKVYWMASGGNLKPGARVLAERSESDGGGETIPLFVVYYVPPGKVLWQGTDETYRWRFRLGDAVYARYWVQAIRYLSRTKLLGEKGVELSADKIEYQRGEPVQLRVRFFDERLVPTADDGVAVVVDGGGKRQRVPLTRSLTSRAIFESTRTNFATGNYEVTLAKPGLAKTPASIKFTMVAPPGESARSETDQKQIRLAAKRSRGRSYDVVDMGEVFAQLPTGKPVKVASLPPLPLWNNWRFLLLFVFLLIIEWLLRKRLGML